MVFGVEAEGMFPISSRGEATYMKFGKTMEANLLNAKEQATYAIALRAGIVADRTLYYAKLGFAQTSMELNQRYEKGRFVNQRQFTDYTLLSTSGEFSKISYVFGGGTEYAIDANWSVKGEYNLIVTQKDDLIAHQAGAGFTRDTTGATSDVPSGAVTDTPITGATRVKSVSNMRNVFKIGVNRRF
jgi:opacity protein-like surface antigen